MHVKCAAKLHILFELTKLLPHFLEKEDELDCLKHKRVAYNDNPPCFLL